MSARAEYRTLEDTRLSQEGISRAAMDAEDPDFRPPVLAWESSTFDSKQREASLILQVLSKGSSTAPAQHEPLIDVLRTANSRFDLLLFLNCHSAWQAFAVHICLGSAGWYCRTAYLFM